MATQKTLKEWISRDLFIWFAVNAAFVGGTAVYSAVRDSATYNFYHNKISSWFDGQRECSKEGGHLVVLETESKWRFITEEIQSLTNPSLNEWHIGLSANYTNASDWRWITGQPLTNPHWQVHEPSGDGKCAIIAKQYPEGMYGHFNDLSCKSLKAFICEVERLSSESDKVLSERWLQIDGSAVKDLTTDPKFQKNATKTNYLRNFKDVVYGQKYGGRYRSYLLANQTGNYTFYTICDDTCQLFLSNGINPRDKHIIIDQTKNVPRFNKTACCNVATLRRFQISSPQYLEKNTVYYMEVLFKQGGGIDQMFVGMRTPSGEMKVPITGDDLIKGISDQFAPAEYCVKKGDPNYPDYIKDCNEFPDSQKIGIVLSLLEDWQSRVDKASNITADFLLHVMETAGKRTSELLESLNDSFVDENMNKSNPGFEITKEVEKLGEIIASRITDTSTVIAVNYSSVDMKASYGEKNFSFVAERSEEKGTGSQDSINIELGNSATKMAHFFSAFYKTLHKAIQQNISDVEGGNPSSQESPHFLNSRIISGSALRPVNETFNGKVTIRLGHTQFESSDKMTMVCAFWRYTNR